MNLDSNLSSLFILAQEGDKRAYEKCIETLYSVLEKYYSRRISNKSIIEDLIQETLMAIHKARHTYDPNLPFLNWARTIARYKMIDYLKKSSKANQDVDIEDLSNSMALSDGFDDLDYDKEVLINYIDSLNDNQKELIKQVKLRGLSIKEAAILSGLSISNVKTTIHRGIKQLKAKWQS